MFGPIVEGELVVLRPPKPSDVPAYLSWISDQEITHYFSDWFVPSLARAQEELEKAGQDRAVLLWSLETAGFNPKLIGQTSIHDIDWVNGRAETDILIGEKTAWGKGIATEVMALRTAHAFRTLNLRKLRSCVFAGNEASFRALVKNGYQKVGLRRQEILRNGIWLDRIEMEVLREDWEKKNSS